MPDSLDSYIVKRLSGTSNYLIDGVSISEVEEVMAEAGYERCPDCETWVEINDLVDEDDEPCVCSSCR
jgi:hypothetical protein